jgi:hypothetical protein
MKYELKNWEHFDYNINRMLTDNLNQMKFDHIKRLIILTVLNQTVLVKFGHTSLRFQQRFTRAFLYDFFAKDKT